MANHVVTNNRMEPTVVLDVFVKIVYWVLTAMIAVSMGLIVAWITPGL